MTDLRERMNDVMPGVLEDLAALVAIPSVSAMPEHDADVQASAAAVAALATEAGFPDVRIVAEGAAGREGDR